MQHNAARIGPSHGHRDLDKNFVKISPAVSEICSRTDRQTDRQTDHNTPLHYWGRVTITN